MEKNKGGAQLKVVILLVALVFLAYGIYGYIYVPLYGSPFGGPQCPSFLKPEGFGNPACLYSLPSLIIGAAMFMAFAGLMFHKR